MTPEDVVAICCAFREIRGPLQSFDVGKGGNSRTGDIQQDQEKCRQLLKQVLPGGANLSDAARCRQ